MLLDEAPVLPGDGVPVGPIGEKEDNIMNRGWIGLFVGAGAAAFCTWWWRRRSAGLASSAPPERGEVIYRNTPTTAGSTL